LISDNILSLRSEGSCEHTSRRTAADSLGAGSESSTTLAIHVVVGSALFHYGMLLMVVDRIDLCTASFHVGEQGPGPQIFGVAHSEDLGDGGAISMSSDKGDENRSRGNSRNKMHG
jgi:hypothetical protein